MRRHLEAVADLTDDEMAELASLLRTVSRVLHAAVASSGPGIFQCLGVPLDQRVPEEKMNEIAERVRANLTA